MSTTEQKFEFDFDNNPSPATEPTQPTVEAPTTATREMDPDTARVCINDVESPIVMLFGPPTCGKTMTLVRLARYLCEHDYTLNIDKSFKNSSSREFEEQNRAFNAAVNSDYAANGTKLIEYLLVRLNRGARTVCQILEAPGEHLFSLDNPDRQTPAYLKVIDASRNRKIWVFFLECTLPNHEKRRYVRKLTNMVFGRDDRFIFLVNKIDMDELRYLMRDNRSIDQAALKKYVEREFPGLLNSNKFIRQRMWGDKELFKVVGFQTGSYTIGVDKDGNDYQSFTASNDSHPQRLWNAIDGAVNGDW